MPRNHGIIRKSAHKNSYRNKFHTYIIQSHQSITNNYLRENKMKREVAKIDTSYKITGKSLVIIKVIN